MYILYSNVLNEIEKVFLRKRNITFLVLSALIVVLGALGVMFIQNRYKISMVSGAAYPVYVLDFFVKIFLPLFIFLAGADMFAGEVSDRTLKLTMTRPISRFKIFISKNIALIIYTFISLLVVFTASYVSGLFISSTWEGVSGFFNSFGAYFIDLIPLLVIVLLTSFIAQISKNSGTTLTTCILIYIGFYILALFFPVIDKMSITQLLDWHLLWAAGYTSFRQILNEFIQILAYTIIFFSLGYYMFDRKEI